MDWNRLLPPFEGFPGVVQAFVTGWTPEMLRWRPAPRAWSVLEICVHLLDEEREDFRPRLRSTLEDPQRVWPAIDPEGWVGQRAYQDREPGAVLAAFAEERRASVDLLRGLGEGAWENAYQHPTLGTLRAGDLLTAWLAHDSLHLRQLARRRFEMVKEGVGAFHAGYAGEPADWLPTEGGSD